MPPERPLNRKPLSRKQRTILDAILFLIQKGELPTVREVGSLVGLRSSATVFKHLRALEQASLISLSGKSRGIRIADADLLQQVIQGTVTDGTSERGAAPASDREEGRAAGGGARFDVVEADSTSDGPRSDPLSDVVQTHLPEVARFAASRRDRSDGGKILNLFTLERRSPKIPLAGAIAAGHPFESYADGFNADAFGADTGVGAESCSSAAMGAPHLGIDPRVFCESGEVLALKVEGDSMVNAGILDGDYAIIRRQSTVEEGEIAAVIINGEGTLKRWHTRWSSDRTINSTGDSTGAQRDRSVYLQPENDHFEPIEITEADGRDVLVIGKYVGLVRGIQVLS